MVLEYDFFKEHVRGFYIQDERICFDSGNRRLSVPASKPHRYNSEQHEAVFKIVSYAKDGKSASNVLHYISKHSEGLDSPVEVLDACGTVWKPNEIDKAVKELNIKEAKNTRQTVHFILSFPKGADLSRRQTEEFMQDFMNPFAEADFQFYIGVHTHQSANHAHVLLKMSNGSRRLKFDIPQLDMMRKRQVEIGKKYGLDYQATRRKDRYLGLGRIPQKPHKKTLLERQVPEWYAKRQSEKERENMGFKNEIRAVHYDVGKEAQRILSEWSKGFDNPKRAEQLFIEMYAEKPKTALWYANNRAEVFGKNDMLTKIKLTEKRFPIFEKAFSKKKMAFEHNVARDI